MWAYTQHNPGWFRFTDPVVGDEAFVLSAWEFAFVIGLVSGFHWRDACTAS